MLKYFAPRSFRVSDCGYGFKLQHACAIALVCTITASGGCGSPYPTCPVSGKVTLPDGTPLAGGTVTFEQIDAEKPISATGQIDDQGNFRLGTTRSGDGALEGTYAVVVAPPSILDVDRRGQSVAIDPKYRRFETSGLRFEVGREKENIFEIVVTLPETSQH